MHSLPDNHVGTRIRTLRMRYGLTLMEVAKLAGLDVSYLSRLEREALQNAKPKLDTINRVLDALGVTLQEREAVYHHERPPLADEVVRAQVREALETEENNPEPVILGDEHWYIHYYNRSARLVLGLTDEEYPQTLGGHMLLYIIDPSQPRYTRVADEDREEAFRTRAQMFKRSFAGEEFDPWYLEIVERIRQFPWAADLWQQTDLSPTSRLIGRHDMKVLNPRVGKLLFRFQLNSLMSNPRFFLGTWTPIDDHTSSCVAQLLAESAFLVGAQGQANSHLVAKWDQGSGVDFHQRGAEVMRVLCKG